jgi:hypothetical protein
MVAQTQLPERLHMDSDDVDERGKVLDFKAKGKRDNRFQRLYEEALAIEKEEAARSGNLGFMARSLVQATLPYREPKGSPPAWGRTNGEISLVIQPGYYFRKEAVISRAGKKLRDEQIPVSLGYPYGSNPRLILAWVATEVVRTKKRELVLGDSMTDFMTQIGIQNATGGKRGTITALKEQMRRLFAANIAITTDPNSVNWANDGFRVADSSSFWWDPVNPAQPSLFQSTLVLSERFYSELVQHPVPIDLRAVRALRQSPMALDVYSWLTWRFYALSRRTQIPWEALQMQFGTEIKSIRKFRQTFNDALKQVLTVYPAAKVEPTTSSLILLPSNTSIPRLSKN